MDWFIQDTRRKCTEIPNLFVLFCFFAVPRLLLHQRSVGPWARSVPPGCTPSLLREMDPTPRGPPPRTARPSSSSSRRACGRRACISARRPSWRASGPPSPRIRGGRSRVTCKPSGKRVSVVVEPSLGGHSLHLSATPSIGWLLPSFGGHLPFTAEIPH